MIIIPHMLVAIKPKVKGKRSAFSSSIFFCAFLRRSRNNRLQSGATKVGSARRLIRRKIASTSLNSELRICVESNKISSES